MSEFEISGVGIWFENIIEPMLALLRVEGTGPFLALVIVAFGGLIAIIAFIYYFYYNRELKKAIKQLKNIHDHESFFLNYHEIEKFFKEKSKLYICWKEFSETLILPDNDDYKVIRNTTRPSEFFDANEAKFTTPFLRIWPNIFVGIGLVLTFAGLISALTAAVSGLEGGADAVQQSVIELLTTTSAKFYTSLVALGSSIVLTLLFKFLESRRDRFFLTLSEKLEIGLLYVSNEEIAQQQLEQMKTQTNILEQFSTDLAMKLGSHIQDAVSTAMQPVVKELSEMGSNMGQNNLEAMKEIGEAISQNVKGAAGDSLNHLSDRLDSLNTVLGDLSGNLKESTGDFQQDIAVALDSMKVGMQSLASDLQKNATDTSSIMSDKLQTLADSLSEAANEIKSTLADGAGKVSDELESVINKLATATDANTEKMGNTVTEMSNAISGITSELKDASYEAGNRARGAIEDAGSKIASDFTKSGQAMKAALEGSVTELAESISNFGENLDNAEQSIDKLTTTLQTASNTITKANSGIDTSARALQEGASEVSNILQPALRAAENIQSATKTMNEYTTISTNEIKTVLNQLENELRNNGVMWEKHSKQFDGVNEKLGEVFNTVNSQIEESQKRMSGFVAELDNAFRNALAGLQEAVEGLQETIEELAKERKAGLKSK